MSERLNKLPRNWKWVALGDVATLVNGRAYKKNELLDSGPVPVLRVGNFFSNRGWYYSDLELPADKYCEKGDLLFAWSASFGPKIWDGPKVIYHYHIWKILTSPDIDKYYLYYLLGSISAEIKSEGNGIAMIHATKGGMEKRVIPLPPLAEQQKIAAILDAADQLRQKDQQLVEHYTALGQSLFLEMFGDPVSNPKGFQKSTVGEQCSVKGGKRIPKGRTLVKENTGFPYIKAGNIKLGKVTEENLEYLTPDIRDVLKRYIVNKGDVCITVVGVNIGDIGVVPESLHQANLTENANKILINNDFVLINSYLAFYLRMGFVQQQIKKRTMAVGVPKLALFRIQQLELLLPPVELQRQFAKHIETIEQQKQQAQAILEKSEALFNSLLQRAFKGELTQSTTA